MRPVLFSGVCSILCLGCGLLEPASVAPPASAAQKESGEQLVARANRLIDDISSRLSERALAASVASENLELLDQRAQRLRERFQNADLKARGVIEPHLQWLTEVHETATLCIGVLRDPATDFEESKAEVLLWTKTFHNEILNVERRMDRVAPVAVLLSERALLTRGGRGESAGTRGRETRRPSRLR